MSELSPVYLGDAFRVLPTIEGEYAIVTSLPDADEVDLPVSEWSEWFREAVRLCLDHGDPVVFYQTDRKISGTWVSKARMILEVSEDVGARTAWHKIVLRAAPGVVDLRRPGYSHLIAVGLTVTPGRGSPDVLPPGPTLYANGMNIPATEFALEYIAAQGATTVVDPFCGYGTVLRVAERLGLAAIGVDIDPAQVERARTVQAVLA